VTDLREDRWAQDDSPSSQRHLLASLPRGLLSKLATRLGFAADAAISAAVPLPRQAVAQAALDSGQHRRLLRRAIGATVRASSRRQALAGLFSAGPWRSVQYVWEKVSKAWRS